MKKNNSNQKNACLWSSKNIFHVNGKVLFDDEKVTFFKNGESIRYNEISYLGLMSCGNILLIENMDGSIHQFMIRDANFYLEKIIKTNPKIIIIKPKKYYYIRMVNILMWIFLFLSIPISTMAVKENLFPIYNIIMINGIAYIAFSLIFTFMVFQNKRKIARMPFKNLLMLNWFIPLFGAWSNSFYFSRFLYKKFYAQKEKK